MVQALDEYDIQQDLPQAIRLLGEMNSNVKQVSDLVEGMLARVKSGELSTEYGLSFLEVKKSTGEKIECDPSIDRLIEIRTVLEKIRPIDYKLRYQIDKLVKTAVTGISNSSDPILFKPNPESMLVYNHISSEEQESESDTEDANNDKKEKMSAKSNKLSSGTESKRTGVYVPPKIRPLFYDGDEKSVDKERKINERAKKRAMTTSIIQDLKEEYLDAPIEISSGSRAQQIFSKANKEKQEYEEAYLTRLPVTKADKHRQRKLTTLANLGDEILEDMRGNEKSLALGTARNKRKQKNSVGKKQGSKKRKFH